MAQRDQRQSALGLGAIIGERLTAARDRAGLTQPVLATVLGVQTSAISRLECGTRLPSLRLLLALARELEVSTDYLLGMTPERPDP